MKVLNIKSPKVIAIAVAMLIASGAGAVWYNSNQQEPVSQVSTQETVKTTPVETPDVEKPEVTETTNEPVVNTPLQESEKQPEPMPYEDAWKYVYNKVSKMSVKSDNKLRLEDFRVVGIIMKNYEKNNLLFTEDTVDSTITTCLDFIKQIPDEFNYAKASATGNCGL